MYYKRGHLLLPLAIIVILVYGCTPLTVASKTHRQQSDLSLKLLDTYSIPYNYKFKETIVGGLSGIDYDKATGKYYIISDERSATSPARFYTADIKIRNNKITGVEFLSVHHLTNSGGKVFPSLREDAVNAADPESIRYHPITKRLVWTDEGDKALRNGNMVLRNPSVYEMDVQGNYIDSFLLPSNMLMVPGEAGPRTNGAFEGSTFDSSANYLYVSLEEPLFADGRRADVDYADAPVRILKFDVKSRMPIAQYAYLLDAVIRAPFPRDAFRVNGISEILWLGDNKLLVMERSYSTGSMKCAVRVYIAGLKNATDVSAIASLKDNKSFKPVSKKLVLNMDDLGEYVDNMEGMTFGPLLPNGNPSLIVIADNNFQPLQKQQLFLFELIR